VHGAPTFGERICNAAWERYLKVKSPRCDKKFASWTENENVPSSYASLSLSLSLSLSHAASKHFEQTSKFARANYRFFVCLSRFMVTRLPCLLCEDASGDETTAEMNDWCETPAAHARREYSFARKYFSSTAIPEAPRKPKSQNWF